MNTFIKNTLLGSILLTIGFFGYAQMAQAEVCTPIEADELNALAQIAEKEKKDYDELKETTDKAIAALEKEIPIIEKAIIDADNRLGEENEKLKLIQSEYADQETIIGEAKDKYDDALYQFQKVNARVNFLTSEIESHKLEIWKIEQILKNRPLTVSEQQELDRLKQERLDYQTELNSLYTEVVLLDAAQKVAEDEWKEAQAFLLDIDKRVTEQEEIVQFAEDDFVTVTESLAELHERGALLIKALNDVKKRYLATVAQLAQMLDLPAGGTYDQVMAEKEHILKNWQGEDCDGDGTPNGQDFYPHDPTKDEEGSTGGIVPCGAVGTGQMCTLCHLIVGIHKIIKWGIGIMFVIAIVIITIAGIMYIVSAGNESMMQAAKKALTYALVGVAIMLLAWVIVTFVISALVGKNTTGGVNTSDGKSTTVKFFSSYSCDGKESTPPTPSTPTPSPTPAPTTPIIPPTLPTP